MTSICFQLFAEVPDVDVLLEMIRSTALTDYIRFDLNGDGDTNDTINGHPETVPLQLINHTEFIKKYLMASELPESISYDGTTILEKGYYKGVVFDIPGAEVRIGKEWIPATEENSEKIKASNPFNTEWRLSGTLLRKMGYKPGDAVEGRMLLVDDLWNGLRLDVPVFVQLRRGKDDS